MPFDISVCQLNLSADDPARLALQNIWPTQNSDAAMLQLGRDEQARLNLRNRLDPKLSSLLVDLHNPEMHRRYQAGKKQPLSRACGLHKKNDLLICDATGGLGRDAACLAWLGAQLIVLERHPIVHALLADGMSRADAKLQEAMDLRYLDSSASALPSCDVLYLDPMFPSSGKRAQPSLPMQYMQQLVGADEDFEQLWQRALDCDCRRIVLKRPPRGAKVRIDEPDLSFGGTRAAYDVYLRS